MGKKYTIELERGETAYKTVDSKGTPLIQLLNPIPYTAPDLEQIRKEGYEKGLSDMWDCMDKINSMSHKEQKECFGRTYLVNILELEPSEVIEKIRQYEQEKEEQDGLRQNIQTIVDQCGYSLDEIATVLQKMKES